MIDLLFWLAYLISGAVGFLAAARRGWQMVPAIAAGTLVGLVLSLLVLLAVPREDRSPWLQVELAINGSLALIFAGAGAAIAYALRERHR